MPVCHSFRLTHGMDLRKGIERCVTERRVRAGVLVSCVGCLLRWRLRGADGVTVFAGDDRAEIVSAVGTLSESGSHLHISLARENLSVIGGHLVEGCLVGTTAEIVVMEIERTVFTRALDEGTGYNELVVEYNG